MPRLAPVLHRKPESLSATAYSYCFGLYFLVSKAFFHKQVNRLEFDQIQVLGSTFCYAFNYGLLTWFYEILGSTLVILYNRLQLAAVRIFLGSVVYLGGWIQ